MNQFYKTIYLDTAAATPVRDEVLDAMLPHLTNSYGNPGSIHHIGREAHVQLEESRARILKVLDTEHGEIIFTGSGSEANNLALRGIAHARSAQGKHILVSNIEHTSVLESALELTREGFEIEYIPVDAQGLISVSDVMERIRPDTILISVMYANNEIGTIEPIEALGTALREMANAPLFHTDACQALGQLPISPITKSVDLMTLNSSKVGGPKGVGLLYIRDGVPLIPLIVGGDQEYGKRAGTENVASIVGFAHACMLAENEREEHSLHMQTLRDAFIHNVKKTFPEAILNGHPTNRLPNNIHFSFPYIEGESLVLLLDTHGVCASTGSACNSQNLVPSHVLRAIGQTPERIHGSLRLSLGRTTTIEELDVAYSALVASVVHLQKLSPLPLHL